RHEKANSLTLSANFDAVNHSLEELKTLSLKAASDISERFNDLRKEVKIAQDQANTKMNSGFELLKEDNKKTKKEFSEQVNNLLTSHKDYAERVDKLITK